MTDESRVYFLRKGDIVKIGTSRNLGTRFRQLKRKHGNDLAFLFSISGSKSIEGWFHGYYTAFHVQGEWFRLNQTHINDGLLDLEKTIGHTLERDYDLPQPKLRHRQSCIKPDVYEKIMVLGKQEHRAFSSMVETLYLLWTRASATERAEILSRQHTKESNNELRL